MSDNTAPKADVTAETSSASKIAKEETAKVTDIPNTDGTSTSKPAGQQSFAGLASNTSGSVFSMFGGGAKKERKEEQDDADEPSGSSKKKAADEVSAT